eukprot:205150-Prorocentrum_minimum.AAC.1
MVRADLFGEGGGLVAGQHLLAIGRPRPREEPAHHCAPHPRPIGQRDQSDARRQHAAPTRTNRRALPRKKRRARPIGQPHIEEVCDSLQLIRTW